MQESLPYPGQVSRQVEAGADTVEIGLSDARIRLEWIDVARESSETR